MSTKLWAVNPAAVKTTTAAQGVYTADFPGQNAAVAASPLVKVQLQDASGNQVVGWGSKLSIAPTEDLPDARAVYHLVVPCALDPHERKEFTVVSSKPHVAAPITHINAAFTPHSYLAVKAKVGADGESRVRYMRFHPEDLKQYEVDTLSTPVYYRGVYEIPVDKDGVLQLRLTFSYLAGDQGIKIRVQLRNSGSHMHVKNTVPGPSAYVEWVRMTVAKPRVTPHILRTAARQGKSASEYVADMMTDAVFANPDYRSSAAEAAEGTLGPAEGEMFTVLDGAEKGVVKLASVGGTVEFIELWSSEGAVPNSDQSVKNGHYARPIRPADLRAVDVAPGEETPTEAPGSASSEVHDQLTPMHDPESADAVTVMPGLRLHHDVFIGHSSQERLAHPPMVVMEEAAYNELLVTQMPSLDGLTPQNGMDVRDLVDSHTNGDSTIFDQWKRGQYYQRDPADNRYYGYREFGGISWGSGLTTAMHYDQLASYAVSALATKDASRAQGWWRLVGASGRHALQHAVYMSTSVADLKYAVGGCCYEKGGSFPGIFRSPTQAHSWIHGLVWQYLLFNDYDAREQVHAFLGHTIKYHGFEGADYGADQIRVGLDKRDWVGLTDTWRYSQTDPGDRKFAKAPLGEYGDFGVRRMGRVIGELCHTHTLSGRSMPFLRDAIVSQLRQVARMEDLWGQQGYILSRSNRNKGYEDTEKPWMHFILTRALNWAAVAVELPADLRTMVERFTAVAIQNVEEVQGVMYPKGRIGILPIPDVSSLARGGMEQKSLSYLKEVDDAPSEAEAIAAWHQFKAEFDLNVHRSRAVPGTPGDDQEPWLYRDLVAYKAKVEEADAHVAMGTIGEAAKIVGEHLIPKAVKVLAMRDFKGILYISTFADMLAFRQLHRMTQGGEVAVLERAAHSIGNFHDIQRGATPDTSRHGKRGFKSAQRYPNAETKLWGAILDTRSLQTWLAKEHM